MYILKRRRLATVCILLDIVFAHEFGLQFSGSSVIDCAGRKPAGSRFTLQGGAPIDGLSRSSVLPGKLCIVNAAECSASCTFVLATASRARPPTSPP